MPGDQPEATMAIIRHYIDSLPKASTQLTGQILDDDRQCPGFHPTPTKRMASGLPPI